MADKRDRQRNQDGVSGPSPGNDPRDPAARLEAAARSHRQHVEDLLDRALEQSFPASDPPSITMPHHRKVRP